MEHFSDWVVPFITMVTALAASVTSVMSYFSSRRNKQEIIDTRADVKRDIQEVHVSINSRMDQYLKLRGEASEAIGVEKGRVEAAAQAGTSAERPR